MIKNKSIKILMLILIIVNLNACYTKQTLFATGDSKHWDVYDIVSGISGVYHIIIKSNNDYLFSISIDGLNQNKSKEICENLFYIDFSISIQKENIMKIKKYLENNDFMFDTSKLFIVKNNKKYKINLYNPDYNIQDVNGNIIYKQTKNSNNIAILDQNYKFTKSLVGQDEIFNLSIEFLKQLNYKSFNEYNYFIINKKFSYKTNLSCKFLDGATLLIDGLYLNGNMLPPIKIDLSYKKPKNHMNQEDYYKLKNIK